MLHFNKKILFIIIFLLILTISFSIFLLSSNSEGEADDVSFDKDINASVYNNNKEISSFPLLDDKEKSIKILFLGDLMVDRHVGDLIIKNEDKIDFLLSSSSEELFEGYDLISSNLEGAVTKNGAHYSPIYSYDFAFNPNVVEQFRNYNFNYFSIANNHFSDQGEEGIKETRELLKEKNFLFSGCKDKKISDCSYIVKEINDKRIGLASYSMVYGVLNEEELKESLKIVKNKSDYLIVNVHWGREYNHKNNLIQSKYAKIMIDEGADIVIGHHPHVVQGMELYKNRPIFYSLGNFIFDQWFSPETQEGLAVSLEIGEEISISLKPFRTKKSVIYTMKDKDKNDFIKRFLSWSDLENNIKEQILKNKIVNNEISN